MLEGRWEAKSREEGLAGYRVVDVPESTVRIIMQRLGSIH